MGTDPDQDIGEVLMGIDPVTGARFDDRVQDRRIVPTVVAAGEQPVLATNRDFAHRSLTAVVVDLDPAVIDVSLQPFPLSEGVLDGLAQAALGQRLLATITSGKAGLAAGRCLRTQFSSVDTGILWLDANCQRERPLSCSSARIFWISADVRRWRFGFGVSLPPFVGRQYAGIMWPGEDAVA